MKTLTLLLLLAGLTQPPPVRAGETPKPAPSSATTEERLAVATKANAMLNEQLVVEERHLEVMKAQIGAYDQMITAPATAARQALDGEVQKTSKAHGAAGCQLMVDGAWYCPPKK
jgi:hypothetical protein